MLFYSPKTQSVIFDGRLNIVSVICLNTPLLYFIKHILLIFRNVISFGEAYIKTDTIHSIFYFNKQGKSFLLIWCLLLIKKIVKSICQINNKKKIPAMYISLIHSNSVSCSDQKDLQSHVLSCFKTRKQEIEHMIRQKSQIYSS